MVYRFNQAGEHTLDFVDARVQRLKLLGHQQIQVRRQTNVIFKFAGGTKGNIKELTEFGICGPAAALGNVGRDRKSGPPNLAGEPKHLVPWENGSNVVHAQSKSMALLPNLELCVVLHKLTRMDWTLKRIVNHIILYLSDYNCELKTENCELEYCLW